MAAIKGVGTAVVEEILRAREDGKFKNVEDFAKRVSSSRVNKKAWDSLIKTGAFDAMADRSDLLFNLETIQAFASKLQKEALSGQTDLFGGMNSDAVLQPTISFVQAPTKHTDKERLAWERELLGLYISAHPLDNYDAYFEEQTIPLIELKPEVDGKVATVGGLISSVRSIVTKSGSKMAFVKIEDKTGETEIIVFPSLYEQMGAKLIQDAVVRVTGKVNARDRDGNLITDTKIIADDVQFVEDDELKTYESTGLKMKTPKPRANVQAMRVPRTNKGGSFSMPATTPPNVKSNEPPVHFVPVEDVAIRKLFVHVKDTDDKTMLVGLKEVCNRFPGVTEIVLVLGADKKSAIKMPFRVDGSDALIGQLVKILGEDAVILK
jgi:DNA polymerase-3 subunit alpha